MPREDRPADDAAYLWDMHDACTRVIEFTADLTEAQFTADALVRSAVERQIEIIGEAARNVSVDYQDAHPEIPWRPIVAQRHILAHEYGDIEPSLIYRVATMHVPALLAQITPLLPPHRVD